MSRDPLSLYLDGSLRSPSSAEPPSHHNDKATNSDITNNGCTAVLLPLAERAAAAFGCDLRGLLLGSATTPPSVQDAHVACSPGGHRSSRAIEEDIAKTRTALAKALADVLLAFLWQAQKVQPPSRPSATSSSSSNTSGCQQSAEGHSRNDDDASSHTARPGRRLKAEPTEVADSDKTKNNTTTNNNNQQGNGPEALTEGGKQLPAWTGLPGSRSGGGGADLSIDLPTHGSPPQQRFSPPPERTAPHQHHPNNNCLPPRHAALPSASARDSTEGSAGMCLSFLVPAADHSRHTASAGSQEFSSGAGPRRPKGTSDFVSLDNGSAFASTVPRAVTMATFLQKVDDATTVSAISGGAVPLEGDVPIEFTATHRAKQARAPGSNRWVLNGHYEFIARIGAGGQGAVWRVVDLSTGEGLAIKIVPRGKLRNNCRRFSIAGRSSAGIGLLAGDLSDDRSARGGAGDGRPNDANYQSCYSSGDSRQSRSTSPNAAPPPPPPLPRHNPPSSGPGAMANSRSYPSTTAAEGLARSAENNNNNNASSSAFAQSALLDGSVLLAQSTDALRLFYEGGANDGGTLPEGLAMEIIMGLFRHPNTVPLHEVIDDPSCNNVFLVMPLAKPLPFSLNLVSGHLTAEGPSVDTILNYAKGAASALTVFHAAGIVHCDIKLENFLLLPGPTTEDKEILAIADFGVCQLRVNRSPRQQTDCQVNLLGGGNGTYAYWAPECFAAKKQSDTFTAASDCYALGLCLYAMVFGRFPYWTPDVLNPLSWEKVVPGTARYQGTAAAVTYPPQAADATTNHTVLRGILQGLLAPVAQERMPASRVVELTQ